MKNPASKRVRRPIVREVGSDEELPEVAAIQKKVLTVYRDAKDFNTEEIVVNRNIGKFYYVTFDSKDTKALDDGYYYAVLDEVNNVTLLDSETETLRFVIDRLDRGRTLIQRLESFGIADILSVTVVMVLSAVLFAEAVSRKEYSKEIIGLFGIVVGFLFARRS